jgi:hypothetical protein
MMISFFLSYRPHHGALRHTKEAASAGSVSDGQSEKLKASACGKRSFPIDRPGGGFISAGDEGHGWGWSEEKGSGREPESHIPHGGERQYMTKQRAEIVLPETTAPHRRLLAMMD